MRVAIVGGGPAGLYFAILMKRSFPAHDIAVIERNRADDTFGFGVVFSDETLDNIERADPTTFSALKSEFSFWDDIEINFKGSTRRVGGNGFCGCARTRLLTVLQRQARSLGVELRFEQEFAGSDEFADADLIVGADGINSRVRDLHADYFRPQIDYRPNRFSWMGSTRALDAFTFHFRETEHGIFIAHCYQYEPSRSTWVLETDPETFARSGLDAMSEEESARFMERIFVEELDGHPLIVNRSMWRRFPMVRCERWVKDNVVLIGDAKATAHFSIGSGTKLAIEDAIELHRAFLREPRDVDEALRNFEASRREEVEKTQHAADVSLVWFEHVARFWHMEPTQFAFGLMTRSKAITYDNLALRAPDFVADVDRMTKAAAEPVTGEELQPRVPAFQPFRLREMRIANRLVVSPMCQYSAKDGVPNDWHLVHYGSRAIGGAGLLFTEMTDVSADARISPGCTGLYDDAQEQAWTRIVDFVHANSDAKFCLQLGHAGRKGATKLMWEGIDQPLEQDAWDIVAPSPLPYFPHSQVPREMSRADMDRVRDQFVEAARRADRCGFDMLELHCAHGYLLAGFISPLTNKRADDYGGSLANRLRYPLEVFAAMRAVWPQEKPMSVRISATDWADGGITGEDSIAVARAFAEAGCDLIDVSTGQTVADSEPVFGRMFQTPFSDAIRNEVGLATMCVGNITTADQANTIVAAGRADLVALARPHLVDPSLTMRAACWYGVADIHCPPQYLAGKDQLMRNSVRDRADMDDMKRRARPASRAQPRHLRAAE